MGVIYTGGRSAGRPDIETWFSSGKANASLVMNRIDSYRKKKSQVKEVGASHYQLQAKRPQRRKRSAAEIQRNINWVVMIN